MNVKQIVDEDFVNYKKAAMFIAFPNCSWKCERDCGKRVCQNGALANLPNIDISVKSIVDRYVKNDITHAIVLGGLEPFDSWTDVKELVMALRTQTADDIVIYTGYNKDEIAPFISWLQAYENIIIKSGRYKPDDTSVFDETLGVTLASSNQFAERIS